jgi:hypothetical protein
MEEWKNGRIEEWKNRRMEGWEDGRIAFFRTLPLFQYSILPLFHSSFPVSGLSVLPGLFELSYLGPVVFCALGTDPVGENRV